MRARPIVRRAPGGADRGRAPRVRGPSRAGGRRATVLVVCADADARRICRACLEHAGYATHVAEDPDEALTLARATAPDVIVTSFPTVTSRGVPITTLVRHDPRLARTPVLNLASWVRPEELAAATAAGVNESLPMPVPLADLLAAVARHVRAARR
jgi:CheY-like chemotaxis protein